MSAQLSEAQREIALADHILTQTYPLVNNPKLLVTVCDHLDSAGQVIIKEESIGLTPAQRESIEAVHDIVKQHRESAVEFKRKESFVLCQDDFRYSVLSKALVDKHLRTIRSALHNGRDTA